MRWGALVVSASSWWHMKQDNRSFLDVKIDLFIKRN